MINQWDRLTCFCDVPGVPLDTNLVEQALILPVRYFAGSFNYHTEEGAVVGDHAMSLIATARARDVEPVAWLTECLRCHEDLAQMLEGLRRRPLPERGPRLTPKCFTRGDSLGTPRRQRRRESCASHPAGAFTA